MSLKHAAVALLLVGCSSAAAANPDGTPTDAGTPTAPARATTPEPSVLPAPSIDAGAVVDAGVDASPIVGTAPVVQCPCDASQGLACCVLADRSATCSADQTTCTGAFFRCTAPPADSDVGVCCLHRHGATSETALADTCADDAVLVCATDSDCAGGAKCALATCAAGITIGVCDANPVCPAN